MPSDDDAEDRLARGFFFANDGRYVHVEHDCGELITVTDCDTVADLVRQVEAHVCPTNEIEEGGSKRA